jgi:fibronectin type 3 domain-containing protein
LQNTIMVKKELKVKKRISNAISLILVGFMLSACGTSDSGIPQTTVALSAPIGVTLSTTGVNQVTVFWQPVNGATSYNLYWSTVSGVTIANGTKIVKVSTPYTHAGLSANTTYYYIVTAITSAGESAPSSQVSATTATIAGTAPYAPTEVSAVGGTNQETVSWNPVSGATSYNIYWTNDPTHVMKDMGATIISGVTSPYRHTNLAAGLTYAYVVTAVNASGESVESTIASASTSALDGVALYTTNCAGCHNPLTISDIKGNTAVQIQARISSISTMKSLSTLTAAQVQAIADVLAW